MSLRSRRAATPVSSSASRTMWPLTRCSPLEKRSIDETSALRQQGLVTVRRASSSFTWAVMAMTGILSLAGPRWGARGAHDLGEDAASRPGSCVARSSAHVDVGDHQLGSELPSRAHHGRLVGNRRRIDHHDIDLQARCLVVQRVEVGIGVKPDVSPTCGSRLSTTARRASAVTIAPPGRARAGAGSHW